MRRINSSTNVRVALLWGLMAVLVAAGGIAAAAPLADTSEQPREVFAAGYTEAVVDGVVLRGTLGQPFVGLNRNDGVALGHGFWYGLGEATYRIYLPLAIRGS